MISKPINSTSGRKPGQMNNKNFTTLLNKLKEFSEKTILNTQDIEEIKSILDKYNTTFNTQYLSADRAEITELQVERLLTLDPVTNRINANGNWVIAELNHPYDSAISFIKCEQVGLTFSFVVLWNKHSSICIFSQSEAIPVRRIAVISRETNNTLAIIPQQIRLALETVVPTGLELIIKATHINAAIVDPVISEPFIDALDAVSVTDTVGGIGVDWSLVEVETAVQGDNSNHAANTEWVQRELAAIREHMPLSLRVNNMPTNQKVYIGRLQSQPCWGNIIVNNPTNLFDYRQQIEFEITGSNFELTSTRTQTAITAIGVDRINAGGTITDAIWIQTGAIIGLQLNALIWQATAERILSSTFISERARINIDQDNQISFNNLHLDKVITNELHATIADIGNLNVSSITADSGTVAHSPSDDLDIVNKGYLENYVSHIQFGEVYMGTGIESVILDIPTDDLLNGAFFLVTNFDVTYSDSDPIKQGRMVWNRTADQWDLWVDTFLWPDNITTSQNVANQIQVDPIWIANNIVKSVNGNRAIGSSLASNLNQDGDIRVIYGPYLQEADYIAKEASHLNNTVAFCMFDGSIRYKDTAGEIHIMRTIVISPLISEYDITDQMDGTTQHFTLPIELDGAVGSNISVYYGGQRLANGTNYTISGLTLTTLFDTPPTANNNRRLILVVGEFIGTGTPATAHWASLAGHPSDNDDLVNYLRDSLVQLVSDTPQVIDSDLILNKAGIINARLMAQSLTGQVHVSSLGEYGGYEQIELGTVSKPVCINYNADNVYRPIVNYSLSGNQYSDTLALSSDLSKIGDEVDSLQTWATGTVATVNNLSSRVTGLETKVPAPPSKEGSFCLNTFVDNAGNAKYGWNDFGIWTTPYSNSNVIFNNTWVPGTIINSGVRLEDATQYNIIISAMGGSITGDPDGMNILVPVILDNTGAFFGWGRLIDENNIVNGHALLNKMLLNFRYQQSAEGDGNTMYYVNNFADMVLGSMSFLMAPGTTRLNAVMGSLHKEIAQIEANGMANIPTIGTDNKELFIGFSNIAALNSPPTANARFLIKIERLRGQEAIT